MRPSRLCTVGFSSFVVVLVAGCAMPAKDPQTVTIDRDPEEVVTVRPVTGSNIPKRVKVKDAISGDVARKSQTEEVDKDGFMRNLRPGRAVERDPGR